jgi:hypothetical protein
VARDGQWEDLIVGQEGALLVIGTGFPLLGEERIVFTGQRPDQSEFGGNCFIGQVELWWTIETFVPGSYAVYVIRPGDLSLPGGYNGRINVLPRFPGEQILVGYVPNVQFTVLP